MPSLVLGSARAQFTITLSVAASEPVTVGWYTADGTALAGRDYAADSGTVVFAPGELTKTIEVFVHGRTIDTEDRVFYVRMVPPVNAILADDVGACVIHVDTTGSTPVMTVVIPKGEKGERGYSAYEIALQNGFVGTEAEWLASLRPSAEELAPLVAALINAGVMSVTASGTEAHPDTHTLSDWMARIAYMRPVKKAVAAPLNAGDNLVPMAAFVGDQVEPENFSRFTVVGIRAGAVVELDWQYLPESDEILVSGATAGDVPIAVERDMGHGDISKAPVDVKGRKSQLRDALAFMGRPLSERAGDSLSVLDYITTPVDGVTSNQSGIVAAVAAANALGVELWWPAGTYVSDAPIPGLHSCRHGGSGIIKAGSNLFYVNPTSRDMNSLYIEPGGTGDGLGPLRPLAGINGAVEALRNYAPLVGRWTIFGAAGTYNEAVILPDWLANGGNYLAFTFPAPSGSQAEPETYTAILNGAGINALQGFLSGAGNRISISNLLITNWFDPAFASTSQVRRGFNASNGSFAFLVNCAFTGNGLSNLAALPGSTVVLTGGVLDGARYGIDNTGGRVSLSATASTYSVIRNALEYGLYQKHESSTVIDFAEFRNNGKHPAAVSYGAAIFAYKSNASVDTRGVKFNANNICWNVRGGFVADNPGNPDVYGTGANANNRKYLCRGGGRDDIDTWESNSLNDMTKRYGGGSTASTTDALLLNQISDTREGYLANIDQCLRIKIVGRAQTGDALITPLLRHAGGTISLGTYRIAAGKYGEIRLVVRPTNTRNGLTVLFSCTDAIQNLGSAVGLILTSAVDLPNVALSVEVNGRAEGGGTASLIACSVDKSG